MVAASGPRPPRVTVCACTYRRPDGLRALLQGLAGQRFQTVRPRLDVIIADNEGSAEAKAACQAFTQHPDLPIACVHEPRRGISHARNACLDHLAPDSDFFAMIDDDEVPEPTWLDALLAMQQATGADVVKGPVAPVFSGEAPAWIERGRFFGWPSRDHTGIRSALQDGRPIRHADTNNVLVRTALVRRLGLRFDPRLALTGGESGVFFHGLREAGASMVFAASARVHETIPPERARLGYLCRMAYRRGNNRLKRAHLEAGIRPGRKRRLRQAVRATGTPAMLGGMGHILAHLAKSLIRAKRPAMDEIAVGVMRIAYGLGRLTSLFGARYEHYREVS